jgi:hypothetical protein
MQREAIDRLLHILFETRPEKIAQVFREPMTIYYEPLH